VYILLCDNLDFSDECKFVLHEGIGVIVVHWFSRVLCKEIINWCISRITASLVMTSSSMFPQVHIGFYGFRGELIATISNPCVYIKWIILALRQK
jgi:hypothetical protein